MSGSLSLFPSTSCSLLARLTFPTLTNAYKTSPSPSHHHQPPAVLASFVGHSLLLASSTGCQHLPVSSSAPASPPRALTAFNVERLQTQPDGPHRLLRVSTSSTCSSLDQIPSIRPTAQTPGHTATLFDLPPSSLPLAVTQWVLQPSRSSTRHATPPVGRLSKIVSSFESSPTG
ncbi:MAG: hypothetical protein Q9177_001618 [Variospora cf. flavescens]